MEQTQSNRIHTENAVLDIGEDVGALIIYTEPELRGKEIEVSSKGNPTSRVHTDVLERKVGERSVFAACFASLHSGEYDIWGIDSHPDGHVTIKGGEVAEVNWV